MSNTVNINEINALYTNKADEGYISPSIEELAKSEIVQTVTEEPWNWHFISENPNITWDMTN
jgi:hypothetical protein